MTQDTRKHDGGDPKKTHKDANQNNTRDYDKALDEAIEESFPASDPIAPGVPEVDPVNPQAPHHKTDPRKK